MGEFLPYAAEYAKTGRSSCKKCKTPIPQGNLRLAVVFQSTKFDGKMTSWYHFDCFFERQRPKTVADIDHFDQLRWEDQEKISKQLEVLGTRGAVTPAPKKGKEKGKGGKSGVQLKDYTIEYAKSGRATCRGCMEKIPKDEVRISKKNYNTGAATQYGPVDEWYHVNCFKEKRSELGLVDSVDMVSGFDSLSGDDKKRLLKELPAIADKKHKIEGDTVDGPSEAKRVKREDKEDDKTKELKKQNKVMYNYRDELENLSKPELQELAEFNDQQLPSGKSEILDFLSDLMTFGALAPCSDCKTGQFYYKSGVGYVCSGNLSEWTKCPNTTTSPVRKPFKIPKELSDQYDFLKKYKYVERERVILTRSPTKMTPEGTVKQEEPKAAPPKGPPLKGYTFALHPKLEMSKEVKEEIEKLGGKVTSRVSGKVDAYISTKDQVKAMDSKMEKIKDLGVAVVPPDLVEEFQSGGSTNAAFLIVKKNLATWDCPGIESRLKEEKPSTSEEKSGAKSKIGMSSKSMPEKMKLTLKGGGVVDPDSGVEDKTHVLKSKDALYSVVLGVVDIQQGRNSYYKIQVLEHDKRKKWYVFRSWGRVGTSIGDKKLTSYHDKQEAIEEFVSQYEDKTGNAWKDRKNFVKRPGKMYPLDIDYGDAESQSKLTSENSTSKLPKAVQDLVCMIFDVETMKRAMVEFELDLTKMPLGKLSKKQLEKAYGLLSQAQDLLAAADTQEAKFVDVSNQFYTLIPHDFGRKSPPLLNDHELIKAKLEMLESLMEIEVAFNLLKAGDAVTDQDPIDAHYEKLNTAIEVLDKSSEEFKVLQAYAKNTHAPTHTQYTLELEEVFKVVRKNEASRFKPFAKLPNRKLLWHGSRVANMAGILSQGLRIAPPEAPVTGYMFGKGIYFADMVSKSANYCVTSKSNPTGLLLLCDVALGKCYERKEADYIEKLKKGYHSVLGVGKTQPDPTESTKMGDVEVPFGKPVSTNVKDTSLLYNEYIVYDVAQVNIKYLVRAKFHYK